MKTIMSNQATIGFRTKVQHYTDADGVRREYLIVPELKRHHCDMGAFRQHARYGSYANSDLFPGMLKRIRSERFGESGWLKLHAVPDGVSVDTSGFLARVTIAV